VVWTAGASAEPALPLADWRESEHGLESSPVVVLAAELLAGSLAWIRPGHCVFPSSAPGTG